jgi:hypothetical protein
MIDYKHAEQYLKQQFRYPRMYGDKFDSQFYLSVVKSFLGDYVSDNCYPNYTGKKQRTFAELRAYATGKQSTDKYYRLCDAIIESPKLKKALGIKETAKASLLNISFDNVQIMPKFIGKRIGQVLDIDMKPDVEAIDSQSLSDKEAVKKYYKVQADKEFKETKELLRQAGADIPKDELEFKSAQQVDAYAASGGFKLEIEALLYNCLRLTEQVSKFHEIRKMTYEDLDILGMAVVKNYFDHENVPKIRYVDPNNYVIKYDQYADFRDADMAGEFRYMTVRQLRQETELSEEELTDVAEKYGGRYGNQKWDNSWSNLGNVQRYATDREGYPYDDMRVLVFDMEFIATDLSKKKISKHSKTGNTISKEVPIDYNLTDTDKKKGRELKETRTEYTHKCMHVVGTDVVFNIGKCQAQRRIKGGRAQLNYHTFKLNEGGIVERCIGFIDDIQLLTLRGRIINSKIPPSPRFKMDMAVMENVVLGGVKIDPMDAYDLFSQTGMLLYRSKLPDEDLVAPNSNPLEAINIDVYNEINSIQQQIEYNINQIRQVTGVNEITDGTTPAARVGLGIAEMSVSSTNDIFRPVLDAGKQIYQTTLETAITKWQYVGEYMQYEGLIKAIGRKGYDTLKVTKDISFRAFGLYVKIMPSAGERQALMDRVSQLWEANLASGGTGGISIDSYLKITEEIRTGNIDSAILMLSNAVAEQRDIDAQRQQQIDEANTQRQIASNQSASQSKLQEIEAKMKADIQVELARGRSAIEEEIVKGQIQTQIADKKINADLLREQYDVMAAQANKASLQGTN